MIDDVFLEDDGFNADDAETLATFSIMPDEQYLSFDDDSFMNEVINEYHHNTDNITFCGRNTLPPDANSDGYVPNGSQELASTISDIKRTFKLYSKNGHAYVLYNGNYYRVDGSGIVVIGGVKYDKI